MGAYLTKTYGICSKDDGELVISGRVDGIEALQQAIGIMLQVECGEYEIFSDGFGLKVSDLLGKDYPYVAAELERRIKECLLVDERIEAVEDFTFAAHANRLSVSFAVKSIYADERASVEVVL